MFHVSDLRSDEEIVAAIIAGDTNQFELLVRRYDADLMRVARSRLSNRDAADEAVHEAFVSAYRSLEAFDTTRSFRPWLVTILVNECHRVHRRSAQPRQSLEWMMDEPLSTQASAGEVAEQRESYERLYEQMSRLESVQADAIWMRFFGRLKYREIAELAGVSLATAKNRVRCGLERLAKLLCEES